MSSGDTNALKVSMNAAGVTIESWNAIGTATNVEPHATSRVINPKIGPTSVNATTRGNDQPAHLLDAQHLQRFELLADLPRAEIGASSRCRRHPPRS